MDETRLKNVLLFLCVIIGERKTLHSSVRTLSKSVKHGGGSTVAWSQFAAFGLGQLAVFDGTINSELDQ